MNDFEKEVFTEEELSAMNEKLKNAENIALPESLEEENVEKLLKNDPQFVIGNELKQKKSKKRRYGVMAASVAAVLVISLLCASFFAGGRGLNYFLEKINHVQSGFTQTETNPPAHKDSVSDYVEIEALFLDYKEKYDHVRFRNDFYFTTDDVALGTNGAVDGAASGAVPESGGGVGEDKGVYGETNEQVEGVSEADIIKNDGKYLYVVAPDNADWDKFYDDMEERENDEAADLPQLDYTCAVSIVEATSSGAMKKVGKAVVTEDSDDIYHMLITEMHVKADRLVAVVDVQVYDDTEPGAYKDVYYGYRKSKTMAICFDISDRTAPTEMWRVYQDGSYISSRLIGNQLVLLSTYGVMLTEDEEQITENCVPTVGYNSAECKRIACDCIHLMEEIYDTTYLVASTLDINDKATLKTEAVLGGGNNVYCTADTLYAANNDYDLTYGGANGLVEIFGYDEVKTQIYKFDISDCNVTYMGNASVEGSALNQFSMDEYNGYLRIATTSGTWGDSLINQLYVLDENLSVVGKIENIAPGESIRSVRFNGDTGYVVTFEQTDPLYVIDLSDPGNPVIKGELKIPGFSSYLHPVGNGLMVGVGFDGDDSGTNGGLKISLFDVSNPEKPVECDKLVVSVDSTNEVWSYINCEAWYSHKAICWNGADNVMYVPYSLNTSIYQGDKNLNRYEGRILALKVNTDSKTLENAGSVSYLLSNNDYVQGFNRVTYIGDSLYALTSYPTCLYSFNKKTTEYTGKLVIG